MSSENKANGDNSIEWAGRTQVAKQSTPTTPALAEYRGHLYMAYKANDAKNYIYITRSDDFGATWPWLRTVPGPKDPQTTFAGPSLTVFNDYLNLVYQTGDNKINVTYTSNGDDWSEAKPISYMKQDVKTDVKTSFMPAVVVFKGALQVIYADIPKPHRLFVISSKDGLSWTHPMPIGEQSTSAGPAAAVKNNDTLYVAYKSSTNDQLYSTASVDGSTWKKDGDGIMGQFTTHSPAIAFLNDSIYLVYKCRGESNTQLNITRCADGVNWEDMQPIPGHFSFEGPALVKYDSDIYVAHKDNTPANNIWVGYSAGVLKYFTFTEVRNKLLEHYHFEDHQVKEFLERATYQAAHPSTVKDLWIKSGLKNEWWQKFKFESSDFTFCLKAEISRWIRRQAQSQPAAAAFGIMWGSPAGNATEKSAFHFFIDPQGNLQLFNPKTGEQMPLDKWAPQFAVF